MTISSAPDSGCSLSLGPGVKIEQSGAPADLQGKRNKNRNKCVISPEGITSEVFNDHSPALQRYFQQLMQFPISFLTYKTPLNTGVNQNHSVGSLFLLAPTPLATFYCLSFLFGAKV